MIDDGDDGDLLVVHNFIYLIFITLILTMIITLFNVEDNNRLLESVNQSGDHLVFPHQENALLIKMIMTMIVIINK